MYFWPYSLIGIVVLAIAAASSRMSPVALRPRASPPSTRSVPVIIAPMPDTFVWEPSVRTPSSSGVRPRTMPDVSRPAATQPQITPPMNSPARPSPVAPVIIAVPPPAPPPPIGPRLPSNTAVEAFRGWASARGIALQGIQQKTQALYDNAYDPATDNVPLEQVLGITEAHRALELLPDGLLAVLDGTTIYLSTIRERPYTILAGNYGGVLGGLTDGVILTQPITVPRTVHEIGHLIGYHGIEGIYGHDHPRLHQHHQEYERLFDTNDISYPPTELPPGFLTIYSTANRAENFAEHFAAYVTDGATFLERAGTDALLAAKYEFLKEKIFGGRTYNEVPY